MNQTSATAAFSASSHRCCKYSSVHGFPSRTCSTTRWSETKARMKWKSVGMAGASEVVASTARLSAQILRLLRAVASAVTGVERARRLEH